METVRNRPDQNLRHPKWAMVVGQLLVLICVIARPAAAQIELGEALNADGESGLFQPFADIAGRAGDGPEGGEASLFVPLFQTNQQLLFADIRGKLFDNSSSEGNWGVGYRSLIDDDWILGGWGFFDLRETTSGNNFLQGVLGLEALTYEWDFRVNGYLAEGGAQATNSGANAVLAGNQILVVGGFERAYSGLDYEFGRLLWAHQSASGCTEGCGASCGVSDWTSALDLELRAFAGGYYFGNDAAGFQDLAGARTRVELRAFDLPLLRSGSRLVLGARCSMTT